LFSSLGAMIWLLRFGFAQPNVRVEGLCGLWQYFTCHKRYKS
jgi:hypothetical protein